MVAKEAGFFLLIILSPLALGSKKTVKPKVLAPFLEEKEVNDPDGGKTPKEMLREKIATIKKLLDETDYPHVKIAMIKKLLDENDNPHVKIAMIKKLLDENDNPGVFPIAFSALREKRQVNDEDDGEPHKEEMREKIAMIKKLLDDISSLAEISGAGRMCDYPVGTCTNADDPCPPGDERCPQYDSDCPSYNHCCCHIITTTAPPPPCEEGIDFGVIMDRSGSVGSKDFDESKNFVKDLVDAFQISPQGTRAGIIAYSGDSELIVNFADDNSQTPSAMKDIIDRILYTGGSTRTDRALEMADSALFTSAGGDRGDKPNVLVVITDGNTGSGSKPYPTVLEPLINKGVEMIAVGVGPNIDSNELLEIANGKQENVFTVDNYDELVKALEDVIEASC